MSLKFLDCSPIKYYNTTMYGHFSIKVGKKIIIYFKISVNLPRPIIMWSFAMVILVTVNDSHHEFECKL